MLNITPVDPIQSWGYVSRLGQNIEQSVRNQRLTPDGAISPGAPISSLFKPFPPLSKQCGPPNGSRPRGCLFPFGCIDIQHSRTPLHGSQHPR